MYSWAATDNVSISHLPRQVRIFTPPALRKSQAAYAKQEVHFLWTNIQYSRRSTEQRSHGEVITHTDRQRKALQDLDNALSSRKFSHSRCEKASQLALESLYFPPDVSLRAINPFSSPLKVYLTLLCLSPEPGRFVFTSLYLFPPQLSKIQFSICLAAFNKMMEDILRMHKEGHLEQGEDPEWLE